MSNMCILVEFLAGTTITTAIREAKEKAIKFDVSYIKFKFNGVKVSVSKYSHMHNIEKRWQDVLESGVSFWVVLS